MPEYTEDVSVANSRDLPNEKDEPSASFWVLP